MQPDWLSRIPEQVPGMLALQAFWLSSALYGAGYGAFALARGVNPFTDGAFTHRKFYGLMGWVPIGFAVLSLGIDPFYGMLFLVFGAAGIAGELLVSVLWRSYFRVPIWTYGYRAMLSGYTSTLNFLPWAVGGLFFHCAGSAVFGEPPSGAALARVMGVSSISLVATWLVARVFKGRTAAARGAFSKPALALCCAPIAVTLVALSITCDARYAIAMPLFGVLGFATEYGYGRVMSLFFDRPLWVYNHWAIDEGHSSVVTLPLWMLGGLYFYLLSGLLSAVV